MSTLTDQILFGTLAGVQHLLNRGADADIDAIDAYGFTPLIETAIANKPELTQLLLAHQAAVNETDMTGRTALHWAADNHALTLCQLLLEHGADPNAYTRAGQPVLVLPLLRQQFELKQLLYRYGANLAFAQDFITTKLIGHRFELAGQVDIVNHKGQFVELDFEGFFLEFTLSVIQDSLSRYCNHFSARHLRVYFNYIHILLQAMQTASQLIQYQHYTIRAPEHIEKISPLFKSPLLLIPVAYRGHAITFIKYKHLLAKCDRGANSQLEGSVVIYEMQQPERLNEELLLQLIYKRQTKAFIESGINQVLGLSTLTTLPLSPQISGNCSWANVEATIPTMLFLLIHGGERAANKPLADITQLTLDLYHRWAEWDKDRALDQCIQEFAEATPARKASKAAVLAAVLFQRCDHLNPQDLERAQRITQILTLPNYRYVLNSYLKIYRQKMRTSEGDNLVRLLEHCDVNYRI